MTFSLGTFSQDGGARFAGLCFGERVIALHARDVVLGGVGALARVLAGAPAGGLVTVREIAEAAA